MSDKIEKAIQIAKENLRQCYTKRGILTGSRQVYWSWDSFFASFGAIAIGDFDIVKTNLKLYLSYQRAGGEIPKRFANPLYSLRYIGLPIAETWPNQRPNYRSPYYTGPSLTQQPIFIIAFHHYIKKTDDIKFLRANFSKLVKIFKFLQNHSYKNGLLKESFGGGWAEGILKRGAIAFTNICYVRSLQCMKELADLIDKTEEAKFYALKAKRLNAKINQVLWSDDKEGFYSDWHGLSRHHFFAADSNILAILWGIADKDQTAKIDRRLNKLMAKSSIPMPVAESKYRAIRIFWTYLFSGMKNYHINFSWTWLGSSCALAKLKIGKKEQAVKILAKIAAAIVRDGTVHEIYYNDKPVNIFFYKSETPWAWSAGLFLYACEKAGFEVR